MSDGPTMSAARLRRNACGVAMLAMVASACVYFNALYNANRLFDRGSEEIESGAESSGRAALAQSIEKAERILAQNPDSRWADDARRLITRARILREEWSEAAASAEQLMERASSRADSVEAAGYVATARLNLDQPTVAESLYTVALDSPELDQERRVELLTGRGAARRRTGRVTAADEDYRAALELQPGSAPARVGRIRLLVDDGRAQDAVEEFGALLQHEYPEPDEEAISELAGYMADSVPEITYRALEGVEASSLSRATRAELLSLRGSLGLEAGRMDAARAAFQTAADVGPATLAGVNAYLELGRLELAYVSRMEELDQVRHWLERAAVSRVGVAPVRARQLLFELDRLEFWVEHGELGYIAAAEAARDRLDAPALATNLFLRYARESPRGIWAPKAILAALALGDVDSEDGADVVTREEAEELRHKLRTDYSDSPYVQALTGGEGSRFTYEDLESALRRQLERLHQLADESLQAERAETSGRGRVQPVPGGALFQTVVSDIEAHGR